MNCSEFNEQMSDYLGEEKIPAEISRHLEECTFCKKDWKESEHLFKEIRSLSQDVNPGDLFWQKQDLAIQEKLKKPSVWSSFLRWSLACSLGLLLVFNFYLGKQKTPSNSDMDWIAWVSDINDSMGVDVSDLNEQEQDAYIDYLSVVTPSSAEQEQGLNEMIDKMNPDQIEKAIQKFQNKNTRKWL